LLKQKVINSNIQRQKRAWDLLQLNWCCELWLTTRW